MHQRHQAVTVAALVLGVLTTPLVACGSVQNGGQGAPWKTAPQVDTRTAAQQDSALGMRRVASVADTTLQGVLGLTDDSFAGTVTVVSPGLLLPPPRRGQSMLRSVLDKRTRAETHQVYVSVQYSSQNWAFWNSAAGENAGPLEFVGISRDVVSCDAGGYCTHRETFGATIPAETLRRNPEYRVRFYAQNGDTMTVRVGAAQVGPVLAALDSLKRGH